MKAFISYSHKDEAALGRLHIHLAVLRREGRIDEWFDREILAGGEIEAEIAERLESSELFLLLVSPDFLASDYCVEREMGRALERHHSGEARVVPIIVEPCDWASTPLRKLKALPSEGNPISEWTNENNAYLDIVQELRRVLEAEEMPRAADKIDRSDFRQTGKFPMDVSDIRSAVLNAGSTEERIRMFRTDRLARIGAAETPVNFNSTKLICVHSAPFMAFSGTGQVDLARAVNRTELLEPLHHAGGWSAPTFNIDGLYTHSPVHHESSASYLQIFRNGTVEAVDAKMIPSPPPYPDAVPSVLFPRKLFAYVTRLMQLYHLLDVEPPYALFVSLLGVRGIHLGVDLSRGLNLKRLDRDVLMLPELIIDTGTFEPDIELKPLLDTLWQSFGVHGCIDYDESGRWRPRR